MATPRIPGLLAAFALVAAACGSTSVGETTTSTTAPTRPATTSTSETNTTSQGNTGGSEIEERIDELIIEAQQIRGLEFLQPVDVKLLSDEEYQARFIEALDEDLAEEDVQAINALLRVLGIIGSEDDYRELLEALVSAGTVGFYDPRTGELVIRLLGESLGPYAESTVIHELVHALQDQHFSLLDDREDLEGDEAYVALAIIEGDATLRDLTYVQALGLVDQAKYVREITALQGSVQELYNALPVYILQSLLSAYTDGYSFHQQIGLDAIDAQFTDPPESSEQLIEPGKYQRDEQPREVTLPDFELPGYELWFDATAGQKDLQLLLTEAVGQAEAAVAASGWGGDINRVYNRGDEEAVYVLRYVGDTKRDAEELEAAFAVFIDESVPNGAYTFLRRDDAEVLVIIASDPAVGPQLEAAFS